jgi:hypothetical protein
MDHLVAPADRNDQATYLFSAAFDRIAFGFYEVELFRRAFGYGEHVIAEQLAREARGFAEAIAALPEDHAMFKDKSGLMKAVGGVAGMAKSAEFRDVEMYKVAADAASLFFAHAVVDNLASSLCLITAIAAPAKWEAWIAGKKIEISETKNNSYDEIVAQRAFDEGLLCDKKSLPAKIEQIFRICPPESMRTSPRFVFDMDRLRLLDEARHDAAHGREKSKLPKGDDDIWFLKNSAYFIWGQLNVHLGLKLDPLYKANYSHLERASTPTPASAPRRTAPAKD